MGELQTKHTCHGTLNWTEYASLLDQYDGAVKQVDASAQVCFMDLVKDQLCDKIGPCRISLNQISFFPLSATCTAMDRQIYTQYAGRPSQCIKSDFGSDCYYGW